MKRPVQLTAMTLLLLTTAACKSENGYEVGEDLAGPVPGMTIIERKGVSAERILAAAKNNPQASEAARSLLISLPEFSRNPALVHSNLSNKIALGLTGAGIKVGVWDTGIDRANSNLDNAAFGPGTSTLGYPIGSDAATASGLRHGTGVAQVIVGDVGDDEFARGVAPGVELHDIAAISDTRDLGEAPFNTETMESNLRYIVDQDLDLVNMSFSVRFDRKIESAGEAMSSLMTANMKNLFRDAAQQGTVFVIATGNSGLAESNNILLGLGQIDDLIEGHVVAVAALNETGTALASYSNACGSSKDYCISAVGNLLPVIDGNGRVVTFSGTSAAAPVVTGSMALLREQFPELGSAETVELIFATADDLGEKGIDEVFGRGALNMNKAMNPVGQVSIVTGTSITQTMALKEGLIEVGGQLAGLADALRSTSMTVIDDFARGFEISAGEFVSFRDDPVAPFHDMVVDVDAGESGRFRADSEGGMLLSKGQLTLGFAETEQVNAPEGRVLDRGYAPDYALGQAAIIGYRSGALDYRLAVAEDGGSIMGGFGRNWGLGYLTLRADFGLMHEKERLLGSELASGSSLTAWSTLHIRKEMRDGLALFGDATLSGTKLRNGEFLLERADLRGVSARAGVDFAAGPGRGVITVGTPLVADHGTITSDIAVGRDPSKDGHTSTGVERARVESRISSGRPVDLGFGWQGRIGENAEVGLKYVRRFDDRSGMEDKSWVGAGFRMNL